MSYLKIENKYIPIVKKSPNRILELSSGEYEVIWDENTPLETREKVDLDYLKNMGEIVEDMDRHDM